MDKRKKKAKQGFEIYLILVLVVFGLVGLSRGLFVRGRVLGDVDNLIAESKGGKYGYGNGYGYGNNFGNGDNNDSYTTVTQEGATLTPSVVITIDPTLTIEPTAVITSTVTLTQTVTETVQVTSTPTPTATVEPEEPKMEENTDHVAVQVVPITQRSVVSTAGFVPEPTVAQTVIQTIKKKIQQIGKGEIINQSKPTPAPTKTKKDEEIEVLKENVAMSYRNMDGQIFLGLEDDNGKIVRLTESETRRIEATTNVNLKNEGIELGVTGDNKFVIAKNGFSASVDYPISVSLETRELSVRTPYGVRNMEIFPDQAISEAIEIGSLENLGSKVVGLELSGQELAYKIEGKKSYMVLGYFPKEVTERVYVNIESGEVTKNNQPWLTSAVRLLSVW